MLTRALPAVGCVDTSTNLTALVHRLMPAREQAHILTFAKNASVQ